MRAEIRRLIETIDPLDELEAEHRADTLAWIDSGAEIFRRKKPDIPPKHLVSYIPVICRRRNRILLGFHRNARKWLPAGGHVEPGEHPRTTAVREALEELGLVARFHQEPPLFLTQTLTVGRDAGHTDVTLWYPLLADVTEPVIYDAAEFDGVRWFGFREALASDPERLDPHFARFLRKWLTRPT